jgi:serine/threonine protein kinase
LIALADGASRILTFTITMSDPIPHAAFVAPETADLAPLFPGYDIEGLIATGGMGAVYRAQQRSLERPVAIKILPKEFGTDEAFRSIFEAEAKAMARLNHPNLIGVYDFGEAAGMLFIIMEYVPGKSLFHSAHAMAIDPAEVVRLVTGICNGLAHAHENGIIHRDIKPSNILLDLDARPKIGDFGLARHTGQKVLEGEEIYGTPHYTAPEVVNAPQSVDHRADIFSLGVLLHELLTGRLPADDPRPPSGIIECDPRFDAIVRRATDPQPGRRYESALEIVRDLQVISTTPGPKVLRATNPRQTRRPGKPVKTTLSAPKQSSRVALIVLLLIAIAVTGLLYRYLYDARMKQANKHVEPRIIKVQLPNTTPPRTPVDPGPTPEPEPGPVENEPPKPVPPPDTRPEPEPEPDPEPEAIPKFDVADFLDNRARKIMRERSAPLITARDAELGRNLTACERELSNEARKEGRMLLRDEYASSIKTYIEDCRNNRNALTAAPPESLWPMAGAVRIHADYVRKEQAINQKLVRELSLLADTYVLGIEKQIERLRQENDPAAVKLLEKEIDSVRENEKYFPDLMLPD